jgi:hypothetical protein
VLAKDDAADRYGDTTLQEQRPHLVHERGAFHDEAPSDPEAKSLACA